MSAKYRSITFDDLLIHPVNIDGVILDVKVKAIVQQFEGKDFEIEYFHMGDVYLWTEKHDLILLNQESFKTLNRRLYERLVNACELVALKFAAVADDSKWSYGEEVAV